MLHLLAILTVLITFYALWVFYVATMNIKRASEMHELSKFTQCLCWPVVAFAWLLDCFVNWAFLSVILFEIPQEYLVTDRLRRLDAFDTGWRKGVVHFFRPLLDPFDPTGKHI